MLPVKAPTAQRPPPPAKPNKHGPSPTLPPFQGTPQDIARHLAALIANTPNLPPRVTTTAKSSGWCSNWESRLLAAANEYAARTSDKNEYEVEGTYGQVLSELIAVSELFKGPRYQLQRLVDELDGWWPRLAQTVEQTTENAAVNVFADRQPSSPPPDPTDELAVAREAKYSRARESLAAFAQLVKAGGKKFKLRPVTRLIIAKLEQATFALERGEQARLVVCVPPRVGKTQLVSKIFPAWFMGRNPTMSTMLCSHSTRYAAKLGMSVRNNVKLADFAGCFGKPWTRSDGVRVPGVCLSKGSKSKSEFALTLVNEDGSTEDAGEFGSYGKGGGYTGNGANLLIVDDMLKEKEVDSEAMIADAHAAVQSLASRLDPEGISIWIVVNTRYRENDVVGHVLADYQSEGPWEVVAAPLIADHTLSGVQKVKGTGDSEAGDEDQPTSFEVQATIADHYLPPCMELDGTLLAAENWHRNDGDVLAPYTEAVAHRKREGLLKRKPQEWWGQYQCTPVAQGGNMVDPAWLRIYPVEPFDRRRYARIVISGDTGDGKNMAAARSAFGVYGEILPAWNKCGVCEGKGSVGGWLAGEVGAQGGGHGQGANRFAGNAARGANTAITHGPPQNTTSTTLHCESCQGTGHGPPVRLLELVAFPWQQPDQVAVLKALAKRWAANLIIIEDKSTGPSVAQHLRRDMDWVRCPVHLVEPCGNKPVRMAAASPQMREGDVGLPSDAKAVAASWQGVGWERGADWAADLRGELLHFPFGKYKDRCDQLSQYLNWRLLNALPAGVSRLEREGEVPRQSLAVQSRAVGRAIAGKAFSAF